MCMNLNFFLLGELGKKPCFNLILFTLFLFLLRTVPSPSAVFGATRTVALQIKGIKMPLEYSFCRFVRVEQRRTKEKLTQWALERILRS